MICEWVIGYARLGRCWVVEGPEGFVIGLFRKGGGDLPDDCRFIDGIDVCTCTYCLQQSCFPGCIVEGNAFIDLTCLFFCWHVSTLVLKAWTHSRSVSNYCNASFQG